MWIGCSLLDCRRRSLATCVALTACLALLVPAAEAKSSKRVYFFSNNAKPIGRHNPLVMRPRGFLLFLDGQWVLEKLHWTHWGSPVARATGISSSSTGSPNAAQGKRIKTWAAMTLSNPTRWHGRKVYGCFH